VSQECGLTNARRLAVADQEAMIAKMNTTNRTVWLSYRRRDRPEMAKRIRDKLAAYFDRDVQIETADSVPFGADLSVQIERAVSKCLALIVVIGPDWLGAKYDDGSRQLDDPWDSVFVEISSALKSNVPVVPIIVDYARFPSTAQLPEQIRPLAHRNVQEIRPTFFERDIDFLADSLELLFSARTGMAILRKRAISMLGARKKQHRRLFINYRRGDAGQFAHRIYVRLGNTFGVDRIFMDVDTLRRGDDFRDALDEHLAQCHVMIALIGPLWLDCKTGEGQRRLDDPSDFVRREIAAALKKKIPLIPILLDQELTCPDSSDHG
jgi:hypothetical protein